MATAEEELRLATMNAGILTRCALDEPVFILRAQDDLAADLVDLWAVRANGLGCPWDKVREAKDIAQRMREWPHRKNPD